MPTEGLDGEGWVRTDVSVETVFSLPTLEVQTTTVEYEDKRTRQALAAVLGHEIDVTPRFFAGTRLTFGPPLPRGVSPGAIAPLVRSEARSTFARRLRERGLVDIERNSSRRVLVGGGNRAQVTRFDAAIPVPSVDRTLPLACWVAPWTTSEDVIIVTGGHPTVSLVDFFDLDTSSDRLSRTGESYREEFFSLLRAVE